MLNTILRRAQYQNIFIRKARTRFTYCRISNVEIVIRVGNLGPRSRRSIFWRRHHKPLLPASPCRSSRDGNDKLNFTAPQKSQNLEYRI